jgi:hypothetical protein
MSLSIKQFIKQISMASTKKNTLLDCQFHFASTYCSTNSRLRHEIRLSSTAIHQAGCCPSLLASYEHAWWLRTAHTMPQVTQHNVLQSQQQTAARELNLLSIKHCIKLVAVLPWWRCMKMLGG